ncbi:MAG: glycosyltransferase family 4 protein [Ruminococcus sp.]|nr:glycosyltransferase family 4 protein [Ruminococcus sp.]
MKIYIDLSNLMAVDFLTGIQRVVKEIVVRMTENGKNELILMTYSHVINVYRRIDNKKFHDFFAYGKGSREAAVTAEKINLTDIPSGAVFFDIDSVWNSRLKRSYIFPVLKQNGVKIVTQLYDLIPITHPQFCHENTVMNFMIYTGANIKYADLIITSADATVKALDELTDRLHMQRKKTLVVPLGSDFARSGNSSEAPDKNVLKIARNRRYILMVGTVEPRKNHSLVIDALENGLSEKGISVIFAGRIGWNVEKLEKRIKSHPLFGKNLFFIEKPSDATVDMLYKNAFAVAFPTFNEGFGLPVIEAFQRGTPVIASDIGVLHEVAGDMAEYFDPTDKDDFIRCVSRLADDENAYNLLKGKIKKYVPFTWNQAAEAMENAVMSVSEKQKSVPGNLDIKQMVCLTARNEDILSTLPYIEKFMPFIKEMVLCTPDKNADELKELYKGRLEIKFLTDSEILNGNSLPDDHSTRNFFLRCLAMKNPVIDDVFIMTDDDYRPLRTIRQEDFVRDGKYLAYYCYDLNEWQGTYGNPTSFDVSMKKSREFLGNNNYPTMMYSSHQPQVIDKRIFNEMTEKYPDIISQGLCEWCSYFNYGIGTYPDMYMTVPYVSMGWPGARSDWDIYVKPKEFLFENHYSVLYEKGRVFYGLSEELNENTAEENQIKILRYSEELNKQLIGREVYNSYCEGYLLQYREIPSFVVTLGEDDSMVINAPEYIVLKNSGWTRIPVKMRLKTESEKILLMYWFSDENGNNISAVAKQQVDINQPEFLLPVVTPPFKRQCVFNFRVMPEDKNIAADAVMIANVV